MEEHVVVVVDEYSPHSSVAAIEDLHAVMESAAAIHVSVVVLADSAARVPPSCGAVVTLSEDGMAQFVESRPGGRVESAVRADRVESADLAGLARRLAPLRLVSGGMDVDFADSIRLLELLGVDDVAGFDPVDDWLTPRDLRTGSHPDLLRAPIGRREDGRTVHLDLKEAASAGMGPHGILVGATGSGKSELLRSLTAGLAARHAPSVLNLLLVDYKGGAAFAGLAPLPHVAGLVTNLADHLVLIDRVRPRWAARSSDARRCSRRRASTRSPPITADASRTPRWPDFPTSWSWWTSSVSCSPPSRNSSRPSRPSGGWAVPSASTCCCPRSVWTRARCGRWTRTCATGCACGPTRPRSPGRFSAAAPRSSCRPFRASATSAWTHPRYVSRPD